MNLLCKLGFHKFGELKTLNEYKKVLFFKYKYSKDIYGNTCIRCRKTKIDKTSETLYNEILNDKREDAEKARKLCSDHNTIEAYKEDIQNKQTAWFSDLFLKLKTDSEESAELKQQELKDIVEKRKELNKQREEKRKMFEGFSNADELVDINAKLNALIWDLERIKQQKSALSKTLSEERKFKIEKTLLKQKFISAKRRGKK